MNQGVVVKLLADFFGLSNEAPTIKELLVFEQIKKELIEEEVVVDEINTLLIDEEITDDEEDVNGFGDETNLQTENEFSAEQILTLTNFDNMGSSGSSTYTPSPPKKSKTQFPEGYLADAYKIWTKQPRRDLDPPKLCQPGLAIDKSPRVNFNTVMKHKRRIKSKAVLQNFEKKLNTLGAGQKKDLQEKINRNVRAYFMEMRSKNAIIHDRTIRIWAMEIKKRIDPDNILSFKASQPWVKKFKKINKIVSRKITHKVSKKFVEDVADIKQKGEEFVMEIRSLIEEKQFTPDQIINTDQSRFEKETRSGRTLAIKGSKSVFGAIGSISASTHSYMIMPVIAMDGTLLPTMYVLVSESTGKFPASWNIDLPNIKAFASKSANMTKGDLNVFLRQILWPDLQARDRVLLLVDSWTSNKDDDLYKATVPEGVEFVKKLIPAKCTGLVQPADVFFFRQFKNMVRFITDTVMISSNINFWHRDHFLRLQSFVHFQFSAPRFANLIRYAFFKCGYSRDHPGSFLVPLEYCFESGLTEECSTQDCDDPAFIKCAHCENCFCLNHSLIAKLHIFCSHSSM